MFSSSRVSYPECWRPMFYEYWEMSPRVNGFSKKMRVVVAFMRTEYINSGSTRTGQEKKENTRAQSPFLRPCLRCHYHILSHTDWISCELRSASEDSSAPSSANTIFRAWPTVSSLLYTSCHSKSAAKNNVSGYERSTNPFPLRLYLMKS